MFTIKPNSWYRTFQSPLMSFLFSKRLPILGALFIVGFESLIKPAHAYIGPGLGLGSLMIIVGLGLSVLLAVIAIFWYPLKRMIFGSSEELDQDDDDDED